MPARKTIFLPDKWLKDTCLGKCSPGARGFWINCLAHMWDDGVYCLEGTVQQFGQLGICGPLEAAGFLSELAKNKAADVGENGNGVVTLTCRRLRREWDKREKTRLRVEALRAAREAGNGPVRERNPMFDAFQAVFCPDGKLTRQQGADIGINAAALVEAGAEPAEVPVRAAALLAKWGKKSWTPFALVKHWGELAPRREAQPQTTPPPDTPAHRAWRERERQIEEWRQEQARQRAEGTKP